MNSQTPVRFVLLLTLLTAPVGAAVDASELIVSLNNATAQGTLVFQIYDDPDAFGAFRDPLTETVIASRGDGEYRLTTSASGEIAVLVYVDQNENGILDKNFIGIPREPVGLSNNYRPKGPPSFDRARFRMSTGEPTAVDIELYQVLGKRGLVGVGLGAIGRSSPYVESTQSVYQPIPTITFIGERLQWLGPDLNYGIAGSGKIRFALTASYRIGVYEEDDSPILEDLGDRESTLMFGPGLEVELPKGFELTAAYRHDVLDRIGGGIAELNLSRAFQLGILRIAPEASLTWTASEITNHDFGVPEEAARPDRSPYVLEDTTTVGLGVTSFIEISERLRAIVNLGTEFLDSEVRSSPIVEDDTVLAGFAALAYAF